MTVRELASAMDLKTITMPNGEKTVQGAYIGDLLSWVMGRANCGNVWITIMSNLNIVAVATLADVSCILLAEGVSLDDSVLKTAEGKGVNILASDNPAYELAAKLSKLGL